MPDDASARVYLGLYTRLPSRSGDAGEEVSGSGYARVRIPRLDARRGEGFANGQDVAFPAATGDWGVVSGFGVFNEAGELLVSGPVSTSLAVSIGTMVHFPAGSLLLGDQVARDVVDRMWKPTPRTPSKTLWERLEED